MSGGVYLHMSFFFQKDSEQMNRHLSLSLWSLSSSGIKRLSKVHHGLAWLGLRRSFLSNKVSPHQQRFRQTPLLQGDPTGLDYEKLSYNFGDTGILIWIQ